MVILLNILNCDLLYLIILLLLIVIWCHCFADIFKLSFNETWLYINSYLIHILFKESIFDIRYILFFIFKKKFAKYFPFFMGLKRLVTSIIASFFILFWIIIEYTILTILRCLEDFDILNVNDFLFGIWFKAVNIMDEGVSNSTESTTEAVSSSTSIVESTTQVEGDISAPDVIIPKVDVNKGIDTESIAVQQALPIEKLKIDDLKISDRKGESGVLDMFSQDIYDGKFSEYDQNLNVNKRKFIDVFSRVFNIDSMVKFDYKEESSYSNKTVRLSKIVGSFYETMLPKNNDNFKDRMKSIGGLFAKVRFTKTDKSKLVTVIHLWGLYKAYFKDKTSAADNHCNPVSQLVRLCDYNTLYRAQLGLMQNYLVRCLQYWNNEVFSKNGVDITYRVVKNFIHTEEPAEHSFVKAMTFSTKINSQLPKFVTINISNIVYSILTLEKVTLISEELLDSISTMFNIEDIKINIGLRKSNTGTRKNVVTVNFNSGLKNGDAKSLSHSITGKKVEVLAKTGSISYDIASAINIRDDHHTRIIMVCIARLIDISLNSNGPFITHDLASSLIDLLVYNLIYRDSEAVDFNDVTYDISYRITTNPDLKIDDSHFVGKRFRYTLANNNGMIETEDVTMMEFYFFRLWALSISEVVLEKADGWSIPTTVYEAWKKLVNKKGYLNLKLMESYKRHVGLKDILSEIVTINESELSDAEVIRKINECTINYNNKVKSMNIVVGLYTHYELDLLFLMIKYLGEWSPIIVTPIFYDDLFLQIINKWKEHNPIEYYDVPSGHIEELAQLFIKMSEDDFLADNVYPFMRGELFRVDSKQYPDYLKTVRESGFNFVEDDLLSSEQPIEVANSKIENLRQVGEEALEARRNEVSLPNWMNKDD